MVSTPLVPFLAPPLTEMEKDIGKSAMEGQLPRINSKFESKMEAEALMGSDVGD